MIACGLQLRLIAHMTTDTTMCLLYDPPHPCPPTCPAAGIKAWRQASAEAQQRQQRYAIAAARWRNMGLSKAWSTWRAWAADQQYKRQTLAVAAGQWRNVRLGAAFRTWRQRTQVGRMDVRVCTCCVGLVTFVIRCIWWFGELDTTGCVGRLSPANTRLAACIHSRLTNRRLAPHMCGVLLLHRTGEL